MKNSVKQEYDVLPVVKNWLNAHLFPTTGEINTKPSLTLPDQSLTVKQMLERQTKGLPFNVMAAQPIFNGEEELPDLKKMDLSEIQDMREFIQQKIQTAQEEAVKNRQKKDQQEREEFLEFKRQKAQSNNQSNQGTNATQTENAPSTNKSTQ